MLGSVILFDLMLEMYRIYDVVKQIMIRLGERGHTSTLSSPTASENFTILDTRGSFVRRYTSWNTLKLSTPTNVLYKIPYKHFGTNLLNFSHKKSQMSFTRKSILISGLTCIGEADPGLVVNINCQRPSIKSELVCNFPRFKKEKRKKKNY